MIQTIVLTTPKYQLAKYLKMAKLLQLNDQFTKKYISVIQLKGDLNENNYGNKK